MHHVGPVIMQRLGVVPRSVSKSLSSRVHARAWGPMCLGRDPARLSTTCSGDGGLCGALAMITDPPPAVFLLGLSVSGSSLKVAPHKVRN